MSMHEEERTISPPPRARRSAAGISPPRYQHPLDARAVAALRNSAGLEDLVRLFSQHYHERYARLANVASRVRVGPTQFAGLYELYRGCCTRLGVLPEPELYVGHEFNAFTAGIERPFVMLGSSLAGSCTPTELEFVIGHELGHVRLRHVLYHQIADWGPRLIGQVPLIGRLLGTGLRLALSEWSRAAEFSADRAGLLACQDLDAALRVLMKLSGVPTERYGGMDLAAFLEQARELTALDDDWMGYLIRTMSEVGMTHPWTVLRAAEIKRWHDSGESEALLAEGVPARSGEESSDVLLPAALGFRCPVCRDAVPAMDRFCSRCGAPVGEADRLRPCPACQGACEPGLVFCEECGSKLHANGCERSQS
jgi:Zn-dependent protease with chaperone function